MNKTQVAESIARELFVNGLGERANRLVLTADGPPKRDLGGWNEKAVASIIEAALIPAADMRALRDEMRELAERVACEGQDGLAIRIMRWSDRLDALLLHEGDQSEDRR